MSEQMHLGFEDNDLATFVLGCEALDLEIASLTEQKRQLIADNKAILPMAWIQTALKVVKARRKLEHHPKEPLSLSGQEYLEGEIARILDRLGADTPAVPDMTGEGA